VRALLDCGPGSLQAMARLGLPWQSITDLVLTHFHADHSGAVPALMFALTWGLLPDRRSDPLDVYGPPGTRRFFESAAAAFGPFMQDPGFEVRIHEVGSRGSFRLTDDAQLRFHPTPHTEGSRAVRAEFAGGTISYTGDTGPSESLAEFCAGSDLLVAECSLPDSHAIDTHLSPTSVAALAVAADPGCLLLTHVYPQFRAAADVPSLVHGAGWTGEICMAAEGWERWFESRDPAGG